ncbi:multiple antibiotic resistance protein [Vibrio sp. ES.051]|uniref:MarC family protein n=1 Tax=Vibrio sp. ES.051 TaxID=1761909 RepID=UPI000BF577A4|nr:MarC family protein [Vibrio sp. ES.051]PFG55603.1 multiple antibiotic resistance protein [Vibrio sp. ES.051]
MSLTGLINDFVLLWAVVDPIGTVPVFLAIAANKSELERRQLAIKSVSIASLVLLFFAIAGEALLQAMDLPLASFQVAGGIILFIFATSMIFGSSKPDDEISQIEGHNHLAIFPLAMPSIASPGAILAAIMMTDSHRNSLNEQLIIIALLGVVLLSVLALLLCASAIYRVIGSAGSSIISRIMGLILATVAADHVINGIISHIGIIGDLK